MDNSVRPSLRATSRRSAKEMNNEEESQVFMFAGDDPSMIAAYSRAQETFRYFWRELSWERRRIVPAFDMVMIKLPFTDGKREDGNPEYEHMWVSDIDFDGVTLSGILMNSPNWLSSVKEGDHIKVPLSHLEDWMITSDSRAYGAFTVNAMRRQMPPHERKAHDEAWGLDFGDPSLERIELHTSNEKKTKKGIFSGLFGKTDDQIAEQSDAHQDHPMCLNMIGKYDEQLKKDPSIISGLNEAGMNLLHSEALAGNLGVVSLLLKYGADKTAKTQNGMTAAELAQSLGWAEVAQTINTN